MACRHMLESLEFDDESREAIHHVRRQYRAGDALRVLLPAGVMLTIFVRSSALEATYNITTTDWAMFAKAMAAVRPLVRRGVQGTARLQVARLMINGDEKQRKFWQSVASGCDIS